MSISFFPPSASDEYKNHPSRHGSIALIVSEVPKMSVRATCFTSSGSNGGCWVVLVPPAPLCLEKRFLFHKQLTQKNVYTTYAKKNAI